MAHERYAVAQGDPLRDREQVLALWEASGFDAEPALSRARFDWFYGANPRGAGRLYLLRSEATAELVGCIGAGHRLFRGPGTERIASVLVDFAVAPAHRTLFPALSLLRAAVEQELAAADFVFGLPDPRAAAVFRALRGPQPLRSVTYAHVIHSLPYLRRMTHASLAPLAPAAARLRDACSNALLRLRTRRAALTGVWSDGVPEEIQPLSLRTLESAGGVRGDSSLSYLRWRTQSPLLRATRTLLVRDAKDDVVAFFVCCAEDGSLGVLDLRIDEQRVRAQDCLAVLRLAAALQPAPALRIEIGGEGDVAAMLARGGFSARHERPCFVFPSGGAPEVVAALQILRCDRDT